MEPGRRLGLDPISGFADDPVCTFNGNFVHVECDLSTPGFAELIIVERVYNALVAGRRA